MQLHLHCVRSKKHKNNLKLNDPIIHLKQEEAEMKEFLLPYGKEKLTAKIEDEHLAGVLLSEFFVLSFVLLHLQIFLSERKLQFV